MKQASRNLVAVLAGVLFGLGLSVSQMIDPAKVINFLDLFGNWDPSLAFVMGGALAVNLVATRFILRRPRPVFDSTFRLPTKKDLDVKLISGALLFGVGWGLAGYCPGPMMSSLSFADGTILIVVASYLTGTFLTKWFLKQQDHESVKKDQACVG